MSSMIILCVLLSSILSLIYLFSYEGDENNTKLFQDYKLISYENGGIKRTRGGEEEDLSVLFQKVKIESLQQFTKASCFEGDDFKKLKEVLFEQLTDIPKVLKNKIYNGLIKSEGGINEEENFIHNITKTKEKGGKGGITYLFMVWWKIKYNSDTMKNKICLVIFGFTFEMSPKLIGHSKKKTTKIIGEQPCKCGLWCEKCPILTEEYVEEPVYEQIHLSLEQYDLLNVWMLEKMKRTTFELTNTEINKNKIKLLTNDPSS
jgi:hypothetical protein